MRIQILSLALLCLTISSCGRKINTRLAKNETDSVSTFPFTLTSHLKSGSCDLLPITHRMLSFSPILLEMSGSDLFIGTLEIALFSETKTYKAVYKEWPGQSNSDQTIFDLKFDGNYYFQKSSVTTEDELVLGNLGAISPFINGEKIQFVLKMDTSLNRIALSPTINGLVKMKNSEIFDDTCP